MKYQLITIIAITVSLLLGLLIVHKQTNNLQTVWLQWKNQQGFDFKSSQQFYRKQIFMKNYEKIQQHNSLNTSSYSMGINQFTHLSSQEFRSMYSLVDERSTSRSYSLKSGPKISDFKDIDWSAQGLISQVKNQGTCDAGYAFCTVSLLESYYLQNQKSILLSEQQVIDCADDYTTMGCNGGSRIGTINYTLDNGLNTEILYPFTGMKQVCKNKTGPYKPAVITLIQADGCDQISNKLSSSPLTVAVNTQNWQTYRAGIYDGCTSQTVNHDILLVGFSSSYWKLKNSWGVRWGEYGYIRLKFGNTCGVCEKTGYGFKF